MCVYAYIYIYIRTYIILNLVLFCALDIAVCQLRSQLFKFSSSSPPQFPRCPFRSSAPSCYPPTIETHTHVQYTTTTHSRSRTGQDANIHIDRSLPRRFTRASTLISSPTISSLLGRSGRTIVAAVVHSRFPRSPKRAGKRLPEHQSSFLSAFATCARSLISFPVRSQREFSRPRETRKYRALLARSSVYRAAPRARA